MIEIKALTKSFTTPRGKLSILNNFSLTIADGEFLGICGRSGAGKSTLLSIIAGLQKPDSGSVIIYPLKKDIFSLNDKELSAFRNKNIGFVSQEQSFLENLTVLDNVRLPYFIGKERVSEEETRQINLRAHNLLKNFGIGALANSYPRDLSGGENHRLLIARALINNPQILLADEPTESVDSKQTEEIIKIFEELSKEGKTVILVSHDQKVLSHCSKICAFPL